MEITMPIKVLQIIHTLQQAGFEAYAVGGCVRDSLLGRVPNDWDITTSAKPEEVKALFKRTVDTGIEHGTVTVLLEKGGFECATDRIDGEYEDGRHPKEVTFTSSLKEDLRRRDFTINAMAYNETEGLIDCFHGTTDIREKRIACVGDAKERFSEDALRMMRAVRFSAQLGYEIEENTREAVIELAHTLKKISAERIQTELVKLVTSPHPEYILKAYEMGITAIILPEFDACMETEQRHPHHCYSVGRHIVESMKAIEADKVLRLAMLFHDIGKPIKKTTDEQGIDHFHGHAEVGQEMTVKILRRLKFDNDTIYKVSKLVAYHDYGNSVVPDKRIVRKAIHKIGEDIFPMLIKVKRADIAAQSEYLREEKEEILAEWEMLYYEIIEDKECVSLKTLAVTGKDLIEHGMEPGKELGNTLQKLLEFVLENPECNTKECLLEYLGL